jgi:hypothetical protein
MPAVENFQPQLIIDVGGIVFRALNNFSTFSGLFLADSNRDISFLIIFELLSKVKQS